MITLDKNQRDIQIPDYNDLDNKPRINGVELSGDKSAEELGIFVDTTNFYTKSQSDDKFQVKGNYLTEIPSEYATKSYVDDAVNNIDVDTTNFYTKEEVNELLANVGEDIPYFVVNSEWTGYENGDFESVRQAILNGKPYFIYAPAPLGGYFSPNYAKVDFGQINCHFFYHTDNGANYYYWVYFHSDSINKSQKTIYYATTSELAEMGAYSMFIDKEEQFGYQFYGKTSLDLKYSANDNKNIAIRVKENGVVYDANNISFTDDNGVIFYIEKLEDGNLIGVRYELGYDDDYQENYVKSVTETILTGSNTDLEGYATEQWVENNFATNDDVNDEIGKLENSLQYQIDNKQPKGNYLTEIPSEYVTEEELNDAIAGLGGGESIAYLIIKENASTNTYSYIGGSFEDVVNAYNNNKPYFIYVPNGAGTNYYSLAETTIITDTYIQCLSFTHTGYTHTWRYWRLYPTSATLYSEMTYEYATKSDLSKYSTTSYVDNQIGNINTILENIIG